MFLSWEFFMEPRLDCKFYLGEKPCKYKRLCAGCPHYDSMGIRILVLKLGAMGDALRTTPVLAALKRKYKKSWIVWVTDEESYPILEHNDRIDQLIINTPSFTQPLLGQSFDIVICLDKDPTVTSLAMRINAHHRYGFAMSPYGTLDIFNDASRYSLMLGLDDDLKFNTNQKTYQQIIYEMVELPYHRDEYIYNLQETDRREAETIIRELAGPGNGPRIGLNTGCGDVFATKKWPTGHFIALARMLRQSCDARIYLLGGASELEENQRIAGELKGEAVNTGSRSLGVFAGLVNQMDALVASDTMALHLALAVKTPVLGLFGPTCTQEIDFYDRGEPIVISCECSPCYLKTCKFNESCMAQLKPETVYRVLEKYV